MQRRAPILSAILLVASAAGAQNPGSAELTQAERELVELRQAYKEAQSEYRKQRRQHRTAEEYKAAVASGELVNPDAEFIPKLLAFEAEQRGEAVGINALMPIFAEAGRGGDPDGATHVGAREATRRLRHYAACPLLPRAVRGACCHAMHAQPEVREALLELPTADDMPEPIRKMVRFTLARRALEINRYLPSMGTWLEKLKSGELDPQFPGQIESVERRLANLPSVEASEAEAEAALETLRTLAFDKTSPRWRRSKGVDKNWHVVRVREDLEGSLLSEIAAALLFKEEHLVTGAVAPDLEVTLLDGSEWRMTDHRGKVVVIQFCFTGCGPCERMYPGMAEIVTEYGDAVSLLTIMRDETVDSAQKKVDDGTFTWNISHDGKPGRVTKAWSVDGFPTVYVVDPRGEIAAINLRGDDLKEEVEKLLGEPGA